MGTWAIAACSTVIFMSLYKSEDFAERLNFKIAPQLDFQMIAVIGIIVNFIFCYVWEVGTHHQHQTNHNSFLVQVYFLDCLLFQTVLPWYKANIRGPNLEFEHLEKELSNSSVWPPLGKNNDLKVGKQRYPNISMFILSGSMYLQYHII